MKITISTAGILSYTSLACVCLFTFAGCDRTEPTPAAAPMDSSSMTSPQVDSVISAVPNPVPAGQEKTMIKWKVKEGAFAEIYVSVDGGEEKLFAGAVGTGSAEAGWINSDSKYSFRLYGAPGKKQLGGSVVVTREAAPRSPQ